MEIRNIDYIYQQDLSGVRGDFVWAGARKSRRGYLRDFVTFDTEWTTVSYEENGRPHGRGLLYLWTACVFGEVYAGRYLDEFVVLTNRLTQLLGLNTKRIVAVYVHNLSADFQFIWPYFNWGNGGIFSVDKRSILKASTPGFEFRCSYKLSNMSLAKFCEAEGTVHQKQSGEKYDYGKTRTPDTPLTDFEMYYAGCDVLGQYEAIKALLKKEGDTVATVPMTSTGYVRRDCRNNCFADKRYKLMFGDQKLTAKQYKLLRSAFRGGNTHANRFLSGKILENVWSYDIASSYPAVMLYENYPCGPFQRTEIKKEKDLDDIIRSGKGFVAVIRLLNMRTEDEIPYISTSKRIADLGQIFYEGEEEPYLRDNGRCLFEGGWSSIAVTNIDWEIIRDHYEYDGFECLECYDVRMGPLPLPIRQTISQYFERKTDLKNIKEEEYFYTKAKNKLNGIYGMMVMALIRDMISLDEDEGWEVIQAMEKKVNDDFVPMEDDEIQAVLDKYYKGHQTFLHYQWGVWVTAYARKRLQKAIDICGNYIVYCDTDSVKFLYHPEIVKRLEALNDEIQKEADSCETTATAFTRKGELQTLGLWDKDAVYSKFITYGAKKYAYTKIELMEEPENGIMEFGEVFHFTVSGLGKKASSELQFIEDFYLGRTIVDSGRTISEYDDETDPHPIEINGKTYMIRSNMAILDTTYTLGVTDEYMELVDILGETYEATKIDGKRVLKFKSSNSYDPD